MVTKSRFTYLSRDGIHKCQAYKWQNDNVPVKGILQIIHGMQEHMERYDEFASFMAMTIWDMVLPYYPRNWVILQKIMQM